jgi:hypothetical protein
MKYLIRISLASLFYVVLCVNPYTGTISESYGQAFCALRQPHRAQQVLFPTATSQKAFPTQITKKHRTQVLDELKFSIHQNELGLHTLYAVFRGSGSTAQHLGFIHVRSEKGEWGLIEIAWALYPDLSVKNFFFQRCREFARDELESPIFQSFIHRKKISDLLEYINQRGRLKKPLPHLSIEGQGLGLRLIKSALKTIAVTRIAWGHIVKP